MYFCRVIPSFDEIDSPEKLKLLPEQTLQEYAEWLRNFMINGISETGGHFAANLGVAELTVALHYHLNTPQDILVWDVGHQAYAHKIITGRKSAFPGLRKKGGISGFPKMSESPFDAFGTGHSSTSISAVLGYATAAKLQGIDRRHVAVIGDGALSAGQAFEAINNAGVSLANITIIINDNHIGIDPSQGAMGEYLDQLEFKDENLFRDFGFRYFGPVDGHNVQELLSILRISGDLDTPSVIHVRSTKGKGYKPAELEQTKWHSTSKFDKLTGKNETAADTGIKYQDVFGKTLLELAVQHPELVAITPAMISGSSLHHMQDVYPERVFDVGIAEQHAVTFAAGMAASGMIPVCCLYSTFLQRAYDQLIHDVALQNLPVIFAIDRAGLVGEDGPTHHGVFDMAFLQTIPGLTILSPASQQELRNALHYAVTFRKGPVVIRFPRGGTGEPWQPLPFEPIADASYRCLKPATSGKALISVGCIGKQCAEAIKDLDIAHYDLRFVKPLNIKLLKQLFTANSDIVVVEEAQLKGGVGSSIALQAAALHYKGNLHLMGIEDHFCTQGSIQELLEDEGLSAAQIRKRILQIF